MSDLLEDKCQKCSRGIYKSKNVKSDVEMVFCNRCNHKTARYLEDKSDRKAKTSGEVAEEQDYVFVKKIESGRKFDKKFKVDEEFLERPEVKEVLRESRRKEKYREIKDDPTSNDLFLG